MKYQNLIEELNSQLDAVKKQRQKHQETLEFFLGQFKTEEQKLRKKLDKENKKSNRKKLKRELSMVKKAYALLEV